MKTITLDRLAGNLRWWKPWECVRLIKDGSVNKIGLTNGGADWWCRKIGHTIDHRKIRLMGSIFGTKNELEKLARMFNTYDFIALEVNVSCPNASHAEEAEAIIQSITAVAEISRFPIVAKLSVAQDYIAIARGLVGIAEAISLNSVPWNMVHPNAPSPLAKLERRVGGGGGGVSGKAAQPFLWPAVRRLSMRVPEIPVIGPSIWEYEDMACVRTYGAKAVSFGAIHLRTPWRPTSFVRRELREIDERQYSKENACT
jgi:dihydroorotate dehydrogenase (NAD+) catalytic subunit